MFHDEVQIIVGFNDLVELNDVGVSDLLQDFNFSSDHVDVLLIGDLALLEYFNGNSFFSDSVGAHHHFTKCSFAQLLLHHEVRNLLHSVGFWFLGP